MLASRGGVEGAIVLDLFSGTGALGLEALSRGAAQAHLVDNHVRSLAMARQNVRAFAADRKVSFQQSDASKLPARAIDLPPATLVFLDPPYRQNLVPLTLTALKSGDWLAPECILVAETENPLQLDLPDGFQLLQQRDYGDTEVHLLVYIGA